ncbi:Gfo/Idh/MocA family oxidoreductase [Candidatus Poribacteria bacterium]|jgi:virulence factor|nr:Gfo/Idh/MocA family oxidoreductase [Candidatus Poribacteria bacterium]MBT5536677.1 Gfo/Idh/MocA family oxidoreductase [Candidatus Poribacteria bacterium]MBT5712039.1 Gfo/Idh/MocA family oxidoreductase [Candidatus Poribacteria bacterium]MBT7098792.1 Gfo/Idh/MocA family oxidoreductase [Candidatus Poribacteria bacterium]MBT7805618.1 Gfo/Idh/MocA family oxidoreductase [Candidatus Poribacteria bacterium]
MPDSSARTRVAFVGAGGMANGVHYPSLASFDDVEIVGISDLDSARLNATADKYGVDGRYASYREMVEATAPDAVYVIGQPHIMYDIWTWCLGEGLNLYIEKPMGITMHQARALAHLAEANDCVTQVSFQRRTCPMVVMLHEECLKRGPITHAVCTFYKHGPSPYLAARDHMMDDSVHAIDTLRWMCGGDVVAIDSVTKQIGTPDINVTIALLRFDNGATGVLMNSWASGRRVFRVEMHSPGVCVEAEHEGKGILYTDGDTAGEEFDTREVAGSEQNFVFGGFQAKNRDFIDAVRAGTLPGSHFGDAIKTMEVAEKILAKAVLGG